MINANIIVNWPGAHIDGCPGVVTNFVITLKQVLYGVQVLYQHPDGRVVVVKEILLRQHFRRERDTKVPWDSIPLYSPHTVSDEVKRIVYQIRYQRMYGTGGNKR